MSDLPTPINRHEQYLNAIANGTTDNLPTPPITREEVFLDYIARNGGGGGSGEVTGVKGNAESTYRRGNVNLTPTHLGLGNVDNTSDLNKPVSTAQQTALDGKVSISSVGSANGVAELDANGRVPSSQLPSYVDDVLEYADLAHFPATGESGKIYIAEDTNKTYRWSGSVYVEISESLALGETSSTAYAGNKGKANADAISAIKDGTNIDSFGDVETALASKASTSDLGNKSNLTTTDKSSVVGAINEVNTVATESITALSVSGLTLTWLDNVPDAHKAIRVGNLVIVNVGLDIDGTFTGTTGWTLLFSYPDSLLNSGESFIKPYFTSMMCMDRQDNKIYPSLISGNQIWLDSTISLYHLTVRGQMILPIVKS